MKWLQRIAVVFLILIILGGITAAGVAYWAYGHYSKDLPNVTELQDVKFDEPLRVYTVDGKLMAEYGEKRRSELGFEAFPEQLVNAFIAAEDQRYYEHPGVDFKGLFRAALNLIQTGEKSQGASTITMQVARNFFLTRDRTYERKIREIILSLRMEEELNKQQIMALYLNKIFLGHRSYGVAAAGQVYYGRELHELDLAQMAMIAGLPKAPSSYNPVTNPKRAKLRRDYVLKRMLGLQMITELEYQAALKSPVTARVHPRPVEVPAPYLGEMVRTEMIQRYGREQTYNGGLKVYTTVTAASQSSAVQAVRESLLAYEVRHGYRGPEKQLSADAVADVLAMDETLQAIAAVGGLLPAVVIQVDDKAKQALVYLGKGREVSLDFEALNWARKASSNPDKPDRLGPEIKKVSDVLTVGDVVRVLEQDYYVEPEVKKGQKKSATAEGHFEKRWVLRQIPNVSGALVSLDPNTGALIAMVGGFDYYHSKFNRATQAKRQSGSNFKPFLYSAALEKGYTPATTINDNAVVIHSAALEGDWKPTNYGQKFYGPTRLREALSKSRNLVSIRLLQEVGVQYVRKYAEKFGFVAESLPRDLSLSLGSGVMTPYEVARGYAVFANGGFLIEPYLIERIENDAGEVLYQAEPKIACHRDCQRQLRNGEEINAAERTLSEQNVYQMVSILKDVIRAGTGRKALKLGRRDLAGKTGTTNDQHDAWFSGFNTQITTTVWIGFDEPRPMGRRETGAGAALPMWVNYMRSALVGMRQIERPQPSGMVTVRINPQTGKIASADNAEAIFETFRQQYLPEEEMYFMTPDPFMNSGSDAATGAAGVGEDAPAIPEQLF